MRVYNGAVVALLYTVDINITGRFTFHDVLLGRTSDSIYTSPQRKAVE